jgi:hypothetical protein
MLAGGSAMSVARFNVHRSEFVLVLRRQVRPAFALEEGIAAASEFFFAIAAFAGGHHRSLAAPNCHATTT